MPPRKRARKDDSSQLEVELDKLSCEELREEFATIGEKPGPINDSNKSLYVRQLARKKLKLDTETITLSSMSSASSPDKPLTRSPISLAAARTSPKAYGPKLTASALSYTPTSSIIPGRNQTPKVTRTPAGKVVKPSLAATGGGRKKMAKSIWDFEIKGLTAATFTPFTDDGEIDLSVIPQYVKHLKSTGVSNVFVNGTTGESLSLTVEERKLLASEWMKAATGKITVIVHVGTENLKNTCELAQHAQDIGAAAIGVMPSTFFKPATIEHLILYLEKVGQAAPSLPMYYYHIPSCTGVNFSMETFLDSASSRLPTLRGLKFTDNDLSEFGRCVVFNGSKYQIVYGCDQQLIGALALGGIAAIGSTYNYAGKLNNRLLSAFERNDMEGAKLEQRRSQASIKLLHKYVAQAGGAAGVGKEFMRLQGIDLGPPRLPALPLSPEGAKNLTSDLKDVGFFEWA